MPVTEASAVESGYCDKALKYPIGQDQFVFYLLIFVVYFVVSLHFLLYGEALKPSDACDGWECASL